jgi:hypothetical protein
MFIQYTARIGFLARGWGREAPCSRPPPAIRPEPANRGFRRNFLDSNLNFLANPIGPSYAALMMRLADQTPTDPHHRPPGAFVMPAETLFALDGDIAALTHSPLVRLAAYWQSLCRDQRLPARRDIDPARIVRPMPYVALIDVHRQSPLEMSFRLVGTELARWIGRDNTGRALDQCYREDIGSDWNRAVRDYERAVRRGEPARRFHHGVRPNGLLFEYERILLPLATDGQTVDALLMGLIPR